MKDAHNRFHGHGRLHLGEPPSRLALEGAFDTRHRSRCVAAPRRGGLAARRHPRDEQVGSWTGVVSGRPGRPVQPARTPDDPHPPDPEGPKLGGGGRPANRSVGIFSAGGIRENDVTRVPAGDLRPRASSQYGHSTGSVSTCQVRTRGNFWKRRTDTHRICSGRGPPRVGPVIVSPHSRHPVLR